MKKIGISLIVFALMTLLSFNLSYAKLYDGAMPGNAINPLNHYAYNNSNTWYSYDGFGLAFRISHDSQLIDTGYDINGNGENWALDTNQWLAGQFTLAQTSTINSIEGYMWGDPEGGEVNLAIYYSDDANNIPTGTPIFKQTFKTSDADDWYGISGINLSLDPGTYWAAFEVAPSQVPIPGAFLLFGSGLLGLFGSKIRRKKE